MIKIPEIEKNILKFWQTQDIFKKSLEKDSPKGDYVFYDGPPFATGTPHYGHIVASLMKDMVPRYWTMQGFHVDRKWGWDTHGLPIENIVEQEMGTKSKKDIENIGVDKFNETCRSKVMMYADEWRKVIDRLGRWADMDDDYKTMDREYMESIWWVFKSLWDKKLIYEGYKSMHICPRCETTLSQHEVSEGYQDIDDLSGIFKFELEDEPDTYILAWTTTPWTLPGNVALALGGEIEYVKVESGNEKYILAKQNINEIFKDKEYKILETVKAKDLEGKIYKPLFEYYLDKNLENKENLYKIFLADFVTVEDGTGVVHIAPAFGEDDMNMGKEKNLPFIQHVKPDGRLTDDVKDFVGMEVKPKDAPMSTDKKVLEYLEKKNLVFKEIPFNHSYPSCWRCHSPLLNYATSSLFVKVSEIKPRALETAKNINWVPKHLKAGRFGQWLEGARDWSISRQRFWGSVIPIWQCDKCEEKRVFGGIEELKQVSGEKIEDLHKHVLDKITFKCDKCEGIMKRVPDVLDCWFESGSMPYAQMHYPFENKERFEANFPAEFIAEGVDQTRAWFYYTHILATALRDSRAYKNVIANGMVLAEDGKKMSKHLNNYPDPMEVIERYGADAMRYYLATSQVMKADDLCFSEKGVDEVYKKVLLILYNVISFYKMFENDLEIHCATKEDLTNILDKWITARSEELKNDITKAYDSYDLIRATRPIGEFITDLSTWYVRRSRDRFKSDNQEEKIKALKTLQRALFTLGRVIAPVMPYTAEYINQELKGRQESVHLEDWPKVKTEFLDQKVLDYMEQTRKVVELGLAKRAEAGIKVRQPLQKLEVKNCKLEDEYLELIKDEVNIKEVVCIEGNGDLSVELDLNINEELKQEGYLRELVRTINGMRKKAGLTIGDRIEIKYNTSDETLKNVFDKFNEDLKRQTLANELSVSDDDLEKVKINDIELDLCIIKIKQ
ncbi:MAG: isoleucine--tRNA ligase [Patescibacteria group bacterium]